MNVLRGLVMAFSCFSTIPMPHIDWRQENMRFMMCWFPAIGLVIGLLLALWAWLAGTLGFGATLTGAGFALIPLAVTGGIHLDGFCDVVDALSSHAEPERKRQILHDPHIGAFAAIGAGAYLLAYAALASDLVLSWQTMLLVGGLHVLSRCFSGMATLLFPKNAGEGMLAAFHDAGHGWAPVVALVVVLLACAGLMIWANAVPAIVMLAVGLVCFAGLRPFADRQFGGMSGDVAGFFLQTAELAMLCALVVTCKVVAL